MLVGIWGVNTAGIGVAGGIQTGQDIYSNGVRVGTGGGNQTSNVALGASALNNNSSGRFLTAIGSGALLLNTVDINTAVGYYAGSALTAGSNNTFLGYQAGNQLVTGQNNVALGSQAQVGVSNGAGNVVAGASILGNASVAVSNNVLIGYNIQNTTPTPGANNIAIGSGALGVTTGSNNIVIGYGAGSALSSASNQVIIGGYSGSSIGSKAYNGYITIADGVGNLRAQWSTNGTQTHPGAMTITNATASADVYSGALVVNGGVGIQGTLNAQAINSPSILVNGSAVVTQASLGTSVSSISAGAGISVSTTTGAVVVTTTATFQQITDNGFTTSNRVNITNGTSAINSTTGALTVAGGISAQGDIRAGGQIYAYNGLYDTGVRVVSQINWTGNAMSVATTSVNGVLYATLTNIGVQSLTVANNLDGGSVTGLVVNATTGTVAIRNVDTIDTVAQRMFNVAGQATISSIAQLTMTNRLTILNTVSSTSTITGALTVAGGVGIQGNVYVGGTLMVNGVPVGGAGASFNGGTITGALYVQNSGNTSTTKTSNAISTDGGVYASAFYLNGSPLSTSTVWNGGNVAGQVNITNSSPAVSTASAALTVTGGIGTQDYIWAKGYKDRAGRMIGQGPTTAAVNSGTAISAANNAWTVVPYSATRWDTDTAMTVGTGRYTPIVPGYYWVTAGARIPTAASGISQLAIYKNGALYLAGQSIANSASAQGQVTVTGLVDIQVAGTDYIDVRIFQNSGGALSLPIVNAGGNIGSTTTYFQSVYIRPWTSGPA